MINIHLLKIEIKIITIYLNIYIYIHQEQRLQGQITWMTCYGGYIVIYLYMYMVS